MAGTVIDRVEALHGLVRGHREPVVRACGLNAAQYAALAQLIDGPARTCGEMAGSAGVHHQGMQRTLDRLERKGLIERPGQVGPGFARRVSITRRGRELVERSRAALVDTEHWMLARFTAELADTFEQCLEECADRLRKLSRPAATRVDAAGSPRLRSATTIAAHAATCPICSLVNEEP